MKLKWKCRRGMKELDILMESYLCDVYPTASETRQKAFEKLLDYQDPIIIDLLFGRVKDEDPILQSLIDELKTYQQDRKQFAGEVTSNNKK